MNSKFDYDLLSAMMTNANMGCLLYTSDAADEL